MALTRIRERRANSGVELGKGLHLGKYGPVTVFLGSPSARDAAPFTRT
ncbi:MAG: hypothetical protein WAU78_00365 [Roseiarcus sp.]|jgi:hypothetical protein